MAVRGIAVIFTTVTLIIVTITGANAQTEEPSPTTPTPPPPTLQPTLEPTAQAAQFATLDAFATQNAEVINADIAGGHFNLTTEALADYHVVYLISEDAANDGSLVSARVMQRLAPSIEIVHTWDELLERHEERTIDALLIHASAIDEVDFEWTVEAYRHGVPIFAINLYFDTLRKLTGDTCRLPDESSGYYTQLGHPYAVDAWGLFYPSNLISSETDRKACKNGSNYTLGWGQNPIYGEERTAVLVRFVYSHLLSSETLANTEGLPGVRKW